MTWFQRPSDEATDDREDMDLRLDLAAQLGQGLGLEDEEAEDESRPRRSRGERGPVAEAILRHREELRERAEKEASPPSPAPAPRRGTRRGAGAVRTRAGWDPPVRSLAVAAGVVLLALVAIGAAILFWPGDGGDRSGAPPGSAGAGDQQVVGWFVTDDRAADAAFVGVLAVGGDRSAVAVVLPSYTVTNIPGYGTAAIEDALSSPDPEAAGRAVENILGVRLDGWQVSSLADLRRVVDAVGGVEVSDGRLDGDGVVRSLRQGGGDDVAAELRFLRWQEVLVGLLESADGRVELLEPLGRQLGPALVAAGNEGAQVLELPVQDIGSGLARPDQRAAEALVAEWFQPTSRTTQDVRLVVMNGVGRPGVAQRVARVLVPSGFELVSSLNTKEFDVKKTRIVAARDRFLPEAELARDLLGTGKVFVDSHPSNLADVTVIVGSDFGGR